MSKANVFSFSGVTIIWIFLFLLVIITLYPFLYILFASVSDPLLVMQGKITFFPRSITLTNYKYVLSDISVLIAYWNTIKYAVIGTAVNVLLTVVTAYPLSRRKFASRRILMGLITFTLLFNGGLIPTYLVVKALRLVNTMGAIILVGAISVWNLIVTRTFMENIPDSLEEAAIIDGCNDIHVLFRIFLPLSAPVIATITLFYAVHHWNSFFVPLIYLNDKRQYPLQVYLRSLLIQGQMSAEFKGSSGSEVIVEQSLKYTVIIVATLPILAVYPFLQKYFVKGALIGSIKG